MTWRVFLTWMSIATAIYYLALLFVFYKWSFIRGGASAEGALAAGTQGAEPQTVELAWEVGDPDKKSELFNGTEKALAALGQGLQVCQAKDMSRDGTIAAISEILKKFRYLKDTPKKAVIDHYLERETHESVRLTEGEVKGMWDGLQ
ncbi:MAG: hypothetical protein Q8938_15220 [Bacteroidota bacterium]|nr:hypothetical protein [Bacteroidota bacterium]